MRETAKAPVKRPGLEADAVRAWRAILPRLERRSWWDDRAALGAGILVYQWAQYRLLLAARRRWPDDERIAQCVEETRRIVREVAMEMELLPPRRMAVLDRHGDDPELRQLFGATTTRRRTA